jgi:hypothetical protein
MRRFLLVPLLAAVVAAACGSYNGGNQPAGGAGAPAAPAATGTAKATPVVAPAGTAMPTGNPDVDYYGY